MKNPPMDTKEWEVRLQFLDEAQDYLQAIEASLLGSQAQGIEHQNMDAILRAAHSIKGGSAMMGFSFLSEYAHRLEDFFKIIKANPANICQPGLESLFLTSLDYLKQMAQHYRLQTPISEPWLADSIIPVFAKMQAILGDLQEEDALGILAEDEGEDMRVLLFETEVESCLDRLDAVLRNPEDPCFKQEFLLAGQELGGLGEMLDLPAFSQLCQFICDQLEQTTAPEIHGLAQAAVRSLRYSQSLVLAQQFELLPTDFTLAETPLAISPVSARPPAIIAPPKEAEESSVRIPLRQLNGLGELFGELTTTRNGLSLQLGWLHQLVGLLQERIKTLDAVNAKLRFAYDGLSPTQGNPRGISPSIPSELTNYFDRLELDHYGDMHLISQEIFETIVQIQEVSEDISAALNETESTSRELSRTTRQMQGDITRIRMRPLSDITDRFPRALRDMAETYAKQVKLVVRGGTTLIEQSILQSLQDPLLHMVRNAFDHGIEAPEERIQAQKNPVGEIEITAYVRGNQTVITLRDDGAGIDSQKIYNRALQMGFTEADLATATEQELLELIFEPGFSTTMAVTNLSGRGVGMDVVRTSIQSLAGSISVETQPNQGTLFTLRLPLSLSVLRVFIVESQGSLFAFPTNSIKEMILLRDQIIEESATMPILSWKDEKIPIFPLHNWMRCHRPPFSVESNEMPIINESVVFLVPQAEYLVGIQVDRYWREQEVTVRPVEGNLSLPTGFSGCIILGDGRVVPLIDPTSWLTLTNETLAVAAPIKSVDQTSLTPKTIMVVDDSPNVRRFLAMGLEKAGYRVEQARDGLDAIEKLTTGTTVNIVISDVEMPRLDGFGFLAQVKAQSELKNIPVVMLTSRSGEKHRRLAMNLGASDYFSKPFKEYDLIRAIEHLVIN